MSRSPNHYETLGIAESADLDEIKRAFRLRALETHPDRNPSNPSAGQEFIKVAQAYETLSDVHKRAAYDFRVLGGRSRTADYGITVDDVLAIDTDSILDTKGDDALEEYIVGNAPPRTTTLATFFRDLERTENFILFRDGKEAFYRHRYLEAAAILGEAVERSPYNILYRHYHALALAELGRAKAAIRELKHAIRLGEARYPWKICPGVRRALHDVYKKSGHRLAAWWMARREGAILFADRLTIMDRERLRLKKMFYLESLKSLALETPGAPLFETEIRRLPPPSA